MDKKEIKFSIWTKVLIIAAFVFTGIIIFPPLSFLALNMLYKFMPNNSIYTLALAFPFIWGPILGAFLGLLIGIKIIISQERSKK